MNKSLISKKSVINKSATSQPKPQGQIKPVPKGQELLLQILDNCPYISRQQKVLIRRRYREADKQILNIISQHKKPLKSYLQAASTKKNLLFQFNLINQIVEQQTSSILSQPLKSHEKDFFSTLKQQFGVQFGEEELESIRLFFRLSGDDHLSLGNLYDLINNSLFEGDLQVNMQDKRYQEIFNYMKLKGLSIQKLEEQLFPKKKQSKKASKVTVDSNKRTVLKKKIADMLISWSILPPIEIERMLEPLVIGSSLNNSKIVVPLDPEEGPLDSELIDYGVFKKNLLNSIITSNRVDLGLGTQSVVTQQDEKAEVDWEFEEQIDLLYEHIVYVLNQYQLSLLQYLTRYQRPDEGCVSLNSFCQFIEDIGYQKQANIELLLKILRYQIALTALGEVNLERLQQGILRRGNNSIILEYKSQFSRNRWRCAGIQELKQKFAAPQPDLSFEKVLTRLMNDSVSELLWAEFESLLENTISPSQLQHMKTIFRLLFPQKIPKQQLSSKIWKCLQVYSNIPVRNHEPVPVLSYSQLTQKIDQSTAVTALSNSVYSVYRHALPNSQQQLAGGTNILNGLALLASMCHKIRLVPETDHEAKRYPLLPIVLTTDRSFKAQFRNMPATEAIITKPIDSHSFIINDRYYGYLDQDMALRHLRLEVIMRAPNILTVADRYYCVPITYGSYPKGSLSLSCRSVVLFARHLLIQFSLLHQQGISVANLRWHNISQYELVKGLRYPLPIDSEGNITLITCIEQSDPSYISPELLYGSKSRTPTIKCDTWVFACLVYEFLFGFKPQSMQQKLSQYYSLNQKAQPDSFRMIDKFPPDFSYCWLGYQKIIDFIEVQHQVRPPRGWAPNQSQNIITLIDQIVNRLIQANPHIEYTELQKQTAVLRQVLVTLNECFSLAPINRPTIQSLLARPCFAVDSNVSTVSLNKYVSDLENNCSLWQFHKKVQSKLQKYQQRSTDVEDNSFLLLRDLVSLVLDIENVVRISSQYYLNDKYVFFRLQNSLLNSDSFQQKYLQIIKKHKRIHLSAGNRVISYIFQNSVLKRLVHAANKYKKKELLQALYYLFKQLIEQLKEYKSYLVYYVEQIMRLLISLCLGRDLDLESLLQDLSPVFFSADRTLFLTLYNQIIDERGTANPEYTVISDFSLSSLYFEPYQETISNTINLYQLISVPKNLDSQKQSEPIMKKLWFILKIMVEEEGGFDQALADAHCPLYMIVLLTAPYKPLREKALVFYEKLATILPIHPIFKTQVLYPQLFGYLRISDQTLTAKQGALRLAYHLLKSGDKTVLNNLAAPHFNTLAQIIRLSIEPRKRSPEYENYKKLLPRLTDILSQLRKVEDLRLIETIPGFRTVLLLNEEQDF